ncbi:MAG: AAA family ATPase [Rickettsiales bacterium]|jgi:DNA polymerase-3 subunit delta'|nr:AAA family ATPase [Rickettsiales bacterium]
MDKLYGFHQVYSEIFHDFKNNRLHHCNLLVGTRGIGKSSFARSVAGMILSIKHDGQCISEAEVEKTNNIIRNGGHTDLIILNVNTTDDSTRDTPPKREEIGVGQTRKAMEGIKLTQSISKNKVMIVDSIDIVNTNGQNALLKVLEEPPANTYLFLVCHRLRRVLDTVVSRCNIIRIADLTLEDWKMAFRSACVANNINTNGVCDEDVYDLSNHSVSFALAIVSNEAKNMYQIIVENIFSRDMLGIQKLVDSIYNSELLSIFRTFMEKFFEDMIRCHRKKSFGIFGKNGDNAKNFMNKSGLQGILKKYEFTSKILRDMDSYNLDRKHCLTVLLDNLNFAS